MNQDNLQHAGNKSIPAKNKIELLSPAGNYDKLVTAFSYGADAAYMGMTEFSLRRNAGNFSPEEIEKVRQLKEKTGKRLYCTMNILFHQRDMERIQTMADEIRSWPFDAFIISDIGLVPFLQKNFPDREMHLSTQASSINSESVKMYKSMGFKRIILGREASLDDIRRIKDQVPDVELEAFVHGAMCMAYSGRCMLSACLAGRSGNQGDCSHTCRWNYKLHYAIEEEERPGIYFPISEQDGYTTILSSKDLCMIDHVKELEEAGLSSLKIEGRMKSIYYVAVVTRAYRKAIDNDPDWERYKRDLFDVSHREYTTGFFFSSGPTETTSDVSRPTSYGYERNYLFLGIVGRKVEDNIWAVDIRNQIKPDGLEFIGPDMPLLQNGKIILLDENMQETDKLDHGHIGYIKSEAPLEDGWIIRKLSENPIVG